jgi:hypothetical protein
MQSRNKLNNYCFVVVSYISFVIINNNAKFVIEENKECFEKKVTTFESRPWVSTIKYFVSLYNARFSDMSRSCLHFENFGISM